MNADDFRVGVFNGDEDIGSAFPDSDRLRHVCSPHFIDLVGDDRTIVWLGLGASNAMRREQAVLAHHPSHTTRARANGASSSSMLERGALIVGVPCSQSAAMSECAT